MGSVCHITMREVGEWCKCCFNNPSCWSYQNWLSKENKIMPEKTKETMVVLIDLDTDEEKVFRVALDSDFIKGHLMDIEEAVWERVEDYKNKERRE